MLSQTYTTRQCTIPQVCKQPALQVLNWDLKNKESHASQGGGPKAKVEPHDKHHSNDVSWRDDDVGSEKEGLKREGERERREKGKEGEREGGGGVERERGREGRKGKTERGREEEG